ncbi:MAG: hypothetical protein RIS29_935 [Bacteroidota bacterium]|jgi:hypothetical protein
MKKTTLLLVILLYCSSIHAATGWYQDYILFSINNGSNAYYWIGDNPSFGTQLDGNNFGTISTLRITGCDMKYWGTNADRTGGAYYYKIMDASNSTQIVSATEILWTHNAIGGNDFRGTSSTTIDLLSNLSPGTTYKLHIWAKSWGSSQGDSWLSNGGSDYVATFTTPAYFKSNNSGNWGTLSTWYSSNDGTNNWLQSSIVPNSSGSSVTIQTGHEVTITANATAPGITVQAGGKLTLNSGYTLTGTNLTLQSDATNGTATFVNKNTSGGITLSGTATISQYLTSGRNWYICSPIHGSTSNVFSASSSYPMYFYNEPTGTDSPWQAITNTSTTMEDGKGYIATVQANASVPFSGTAFNDGNINIALTRTTGQNKEGFNLIGNPYPSFLDISTLTSNTDLLPTYWYRSKNGSYIFDTYNIPSGVGTGNSGYTVSNLIPPMQAFWMRVKSGIANATINLSNSMRAHQDYSNNRFRTKAIKNEEQKVIRLQISNDTYSDEAVLVENPNASNEMDDYDSPKLTNGKAEIPEIYFGNLNNTLAIDGVNAIPTDTEIPLGTYTGQTSSYNIKVTELTNIDSTYKLYIKDKTANKIQEISTALPYTFKADSANTDSRLSLILKTAAIATEADNTESRDGILLLSTKDEIKVLLSDNKSSDIRISILTINGQLVNQSNGTSTIKKPSIKGTYLIKVTSNNKSYCGKLIIE